MIRPRFESDSGEITFECDTPAEAQYVREHCAAILDKYVELYFNNIDGLNIHCWNDYVKYGKASFEKQAEMQHGRPLTQDELEKFDQSDKFSAFAIYVKSTENMKANSLTATRLRQLANSMFEETECEKMHSV